MNADRVDPHKSTRKGRETMRFLTLIPTLASLLIAAMVMGVVLDLVGRYV